MNDRGLSLTPDGHAQGIPARQHRRGQAHSPPTLAGVTASASSTTPARKSSPTASRHGCAASTPPRSASARRARSPRISTASAPSSTAGCATPSDTSASRPSDDFFQFIDSRLRLLQPPIPAPDRGLAEARRRAWSTCSTTPSTASLCNTCCSSPRSSPRTARPVVLQQDSAWSAHYLDILLAWRLWNFRSIAYSTMQYAMFMVMRDIRGLAPEPLAYKSASSSRARKRRPSPATTGCESTSRTATPYIASSRG